jgi:hypothetical protein
LKPAKKEVLKERGHSSLSPTLQKTEKEMPLMDIPEPKDPGDPSVSVEGGSPWAQWDYTPEEWRLFDQRDWDRTVRQFVRSMRELVRLYLILAVFGVLFFLILTITGLEPPVSPPLFGVEALGIAAVMLLVSQSLR